MVTTSRCVCPGSFDPVTLGHVDVFRRAARLYDEVVIAVLVNPAKTGLFTPSERVRFLQDATVDLANVRVESFEAQLVVDVCREVGAEVIVKGIRGESDYTYELPMAVMNRHLSGVETVFVPGDPRYTQVSSSLLKEVASFGGDITPFVTPTVAEALRGSTRG